MHHTLSVCVGPKCRASGSRELLDFVENEVHNYQGNQVKLTEMCDVSVKFCDKFCEHGPIIFCDQKVYSDMTEDRTKVLLSALYNRNYELLLTLNPQDSKE